VRKEAFKWNWGKKGLFQKLLLLIEGGIHSDRDKTQIREVEGLTGKSIPVNRTANISDRRHFHFFGWQSL